MKLFIDDERFPVDGEYHIARSSHEAIEFVRAYGIPTTISFDHDLGGEDTVRVFIHWLMDYLIVNEYTLPEDFSFEIHSQNPVGRDWIRGTMLQLIKHFGYKYA